MAATDDTVTDDIRQAPDRADIDSKRSVLGHSRITGGVQAIINPVAIR